MVTDAVVLAGGLGTRIQSVTGGLIPKVLVPVLGRPFIDYKLRSLSSMGVDRVVLLVGEGADQVADHVGDGRSFSLDIEYCRDGDQLLGTAGAIRSALPLLPERFWVTYGDSVGYADLDQIEGAVIAGNADAAMTVLENNNQWDTSNVDVVNGFVGAYRSNPPPGGFRWIDYGLLLLQRVNFADVAEREVTDLAVVLERLVVNGALLAAPVLERFWEIGTPQGLHDTTQHFQDVGMWQRLS